MNPRTNTDHGSIVLLSCYESGRQPLYLAWPLAVLKEVNLPARAFDLAVEEFPTHAISVATFVGISAPMHTALRLGVQVAERIRSINPDVHICFYGLYAWLNAEYLLEKYADSIITGEPERPLLELIQTLERGGIPDHVSAVTTQSTKSAPNLERSTLPIPDRKPLPPLENYAQYTSPESRTLAGYVESSRGCLHTCTHCPVVPVYNGRFFVIPLETVLADIRQQVAAGGGHITFGDPDFLNGPGHALKIARALHAEFPWLSFDFTAKVEHIVEQRAFFPEFSQLGCTFITSAFESTRDHILARLQKGHTLKDMGTALEILAGAGIAIQPTWMPFTPWTSLEDYLHLLGWIRSHNFIFHVPVVQLSIRMLVPPNSALLNQPDADAWLGPFDPSNFTYRWAHPDARMDELQMQVAALAESQSASDAFAAFSAIETLANQYAGIISESAPIPLTALFAPPRLTEDWFC